MEQTHLTSVLAEALRGQRAVEEEEDVGLRVRRPGALRRRGQQAEVKSPSSMAPLSCSLLRFNHIHLVQPVTTLWEVMFWWLPDLDDDDEEDEEDNEGDIHREKTKRGGAACPARGLRNKRLTDKNLVKRREGKLKERRAKRKSEDRIGEKKETEDPAAVEEEEQEEPEEFGQKNKQPEKRKVKKRLQRHEFSPTEDQTPLIS